MGVRTIAEGCVFERNLVSANVTVGIRVEGRDHLIQDNYVGTDVTGTRALGNGDTGLAMTGSWTADSQVRRNVVSANPAYGILVNGEGNLISGNLNSGLVLVGDNTHGNRIEANLIGTDITGLQPLPNGFGVGIGSSSHDNTIGGEDPGKGNVIAYNNAGGIIVSFYDYENGWPYPHGNSLLGNSIHDNANFGVWFPMTNHEWDVVPNDVLDADSGPNGLQSYPVIESASSTANTTLVTGSLNGSAGTSFRIEFFSNPMRDASGYGEGQAYLGFSDQTADDQGNVSFAVTLPVGTPIGSIITATATDPNGNTSPFSSCLTVPPVTEGDTTPPVITSPGNLSAEATSPAGASVAFTVTAQDETSGTVAVTCTATDATGNSVTGTFRVIRAALEFTGFLPPVGGADATGGSFASPARTFKAGSTIPVKFAAACGGLPVLTGIHKLQAIRFTDATTSDEPIDASPRDAATTGNQFRLTGGQWHFNVDTKATGMTKGIWQLIATLSDGSQHVVWIQLK